MTPKTNKEITYIFNMRRNRRFLQKHLALLVGHRYTYMVSKYEHGVSLPPLETALILEIALGVRLADLYPALYQRLIRQVLQRSRSLPRALRRDVVGRLLGKDDDAHT
jgi:hypothetical protein